MDLVVSDLNSQSSKKRKESFVSFCSLINSVLLAQQTALAHLGSEVVVDVTLRELESDKKGDLVTHVEDDFISQRSRFGEVEKVLEGETEGNVLLENDGDAHVIACLGFDLWEGERGRYQMARWQRVKSQDPRDPTRGGGGEEV